MTENRVHPDLNMAEEYTRSGHTKSNVNINMDAKGYIEQIPALNAPGGLAVAGHTVCHIVPATFSFNAVSHVQGEVDRFLDNFVINDIPVLQRGGRLRPIFVLMMARLVSAFNWLEDAFGTDHVLVQKILRIRKLLNIRNDRVPQAGNVDRHHEILRNWSKVIQDDYKNEMSRRLLRKVLDLIKSLMFVAVGKYGNL